MVSPADLADWLVDGNELAILDAREQGVFFDSHLFHAACIPLSHLELEIGRLVPNLEVRMVWCGDSDGLAERAVAVCERLGYTNVDTLEGGISAWAEAGYELYSGVNVPSKAFGEIVEQRFDTPRIPASELNSLLGSNLVILDSRPMKEFTNMSIPGGVDCPGAELVYRARHLAPDSDTLVVVNCAGRTRSIIGAQSLINAGLPNRVVALENGTMGWELAGLEVSRGETEHAADPPDIVWSSEAALGVGNRFGVRMLGDDAYEGTTYLLDVRTPDEFAAGHLPGSQSAPGGQLVQATDEYVATRNARLVLVDNDGVRATMTGSWLRQLGWEHVYTRLIGDDPLETESAEAELSSLPPAEAITCEALNRRLGDIAVLDLGTSLKYRKMGHVPGAWWAVRSRLDDAAVAIGQPPIIVLVSNDGRLARLATVDASATWPDAKILYLDGGNMAWRVGGYEMEPGFTRPTTEANDVWYKPYDHDDPDVHPDMMRAYLTWEIALAEKLERDLTVSFPMFD